MSALVISIILTVVILALSILTITKGYGYKHTIDPAVDSEEEAGEEADETADKSEEL